jgi:hypothetical protein
MYVPATNISTKVDPFSVLSVLYAYICDVSHIYKDFWKKSGKPLFFPA